MLSTFDSANRCSLRRIVSGDPIFYISAKEAVEQWLYKPTLLNNEPVEVITDITVHFTLSN